ncbi:hypothetical protein A2U01_0057784, partial [Trifolium medium]|nr:hypothetical protein [Trifolium medium]
MVGSGKRSGTVTAFNAR